MEVRNSGDCALQGDVQMKLHSGSVEHESVCVWLSTHKRENSVGFSWQQSAFYCK